MYKLFSLSIALTVLYCVILNSAELHDIHCICSCSVTNDTNSSAVRVDVYINFTGCNIVECFLQCGIENPICDSEFERVETKCIDK